MKLAYKSEYNKKYMSELNNNPDKIKYWFIDMEGNKIDIIPLGKILGGIFIHCFNAENGQELSIHRSRIKWELCTYQI